MGQVLSSISSVWSRLNLSVRSATSHFDEDVDQMSLLPVLYSDFTLIDHRIWMRMLLQPLEQEVVWRSLSLSFFVDQRTGKNCFLVGARKLEISWGDSSEYWEWTSHADSRFREVAKLKSVWWFDIRCKIKTTMLSPETSYAAFLVFKLAEGSKGLQAAKAIIRYPNHESDEDAETKRACVVCLQTMGNIRDHFAVNRADGWMEVYMGNFYVDHGEQREVDVRLVETTSYKTGLIVEGIEFRPH